MHDYKINILFKQSINYFRLQKRLKKRTKCCLNISVYTLDFVDFREILERKKKK